MKKIVSVGLVALTLSACSLFPSKKTPTATTTNSATPSASASSERQLSTLFTIDDKGKTVSVTKGQLFGVRLASAPASGNAWVMKTKPTVAIVKYLSTKYYVPETDAKSKTPKDGYEIGAFEAVATGTTNFSLEFQDKNGKVLKTFVLTVVVK